MAQQTAMQELKSILMRPEPLFFNDLLKLVDNLIEKEKEQIVKARLSGGCIVCYDGENTEIGEQYYNENYNK